MRPSMVLVSALLAVVAGYASVAVAQTMSEETAALIEAKRQALAAERRSQALESAAARAKDAATRARAEASAVAASIQAAEADIAAAQSRIRIVEVLRARQRATLAEKQAPVAKLVAAMQTMARRPPVLALVQPGSLDDVVHVRSMLAATLPLIRARTAELRAEVAEGDRLRLRADLAMATLKSGQDQLRARRVALARLEASQRQRSQTYVDSAMFEQDRAIALGEQARDIVDLMQELNVQAAKRERLATLPGPLPRPLQPGQPAPLPSAERAEAGTIGTRPAYRLPVIGRLVTGLGEVSETGVRARGLTLATAPDAQVIAPAAGRVAYAGVFRGYGRIVIVDHGNGWTTLIAGMGTVAVRVGAVIDQGAPIGRAGTSRPRITIELRRDGRPVDIAPLAAA